VSGSVDMEPEAQSLSANSKFEVVVSEFAIYTMSGATRLASNGCTSAVLEHGRVCALQRIAEARKASCVAVPTPLELFRERTTMIVLTCLRKCWRWLARYCPPTSENVNHRAIRA